MSSISSQSHPNAAKAGGGLFVALIPWALFTIFVHHASLRLGASVALLAAIGIAAPGVIARQPKALELGAVAAFAAFLAAAFVVDHHTTIWVGRYARAFAAGGLALIAFGSLLSTPFTEQYARQSVPQKLWGSESFKAANRRLTALWGGVFVAMIPCHIVAGAIDTRRGNIVFNWVLPGLLVLWAARRSRTAGADETTASAAR